MQERAIPGIDGEANISENVLGTGWDGLKVGKGAARTYVVEKEVRPIVRSYVGWVGSDADDDSNTYLCLDFWTSNAYSSVGEPSVGHQPGKTTMVTASLLTANDQ